MFEGGIDPVGAAEDRGFARDDTRAYLLAGGNQGGGDVSAAHILSQRGRNLPRYGVLVGSRDQRGRPWPAPAMHRASGSRG